jgi:hypothetical protein
MHHYYGIRPWFEHCWGTTERSDIQITKIRAMVSEEQESEAVEEGWLALDEPAKVPGKRKPTEVFYQSRSTRINLLKWKSQYKKYELDGVPISMMGIHPSQANITLTGLHRVYIEYIKRKGYKDLFDPLKHINARDSFLIYFQGEMTNIIGFTKMKSYNCEPPDDDIYDRLPKRIRKQLRLWPVGPVAAVETYMHCNTVEGLSRMTLDMECGHWSTKGAPYLYSGPGYEECSVYKSYVPGFEWWTGWKWSADVTRYRKLCYRDSKMKSIEDLGRANL